MRCKLPDEPVKLLRVGDRNGSYILPTDHCQQNRIRFLPPYSPDFNPIEKHWSKVKATLRSAKASTAAALNRAIAAALATITPQDAAGWFASCGYKIS